MEMNGLKIELLQKIIACEDMELLREVQRVLNEDPSEVKETGAKYKSKPTAVDPVPESHYEKLEEDYQKYLKGELQSFSWDEVKGNLKKKYGF